MDQPRPLVVTSDRTRVDNSYIQDLQGLYPWIKV